MVDNCSRVFFCRMEPLSSAESQSGKISVSLWFGMLEWQNGSLRMGGMSACYLEYGRAVCRVCEYVRIVGRVCQSTRWSMVKW